MLTVTVAIAGLETTEKYDRRWSFDLFLCMPCDQTESRRLNGLGAISDRLLSRLRNFCSLVAM
ncbi:hypothetical protein WI42_08455 [Burkholderia ubonensis]|nr:hypothetical protein WI42_08455 [Burkholderia ubonensis]